jgi:hypothetical protein
MEVVILTPAIKKLSLRTGKHSHPPLDDLKATLFLVYAKQINKKGLSLLCCSPCVQH